MVQDFFHPLYEKDSALGSSTGPRRGRSTSFATSAGFASQNDLTNVLASIDTHDKNKRALKEETPTHPNMELFA